VSGREDKEYSPVDSSASLHQLSLAFSSQPFFAFPFRAQLALMNHLTALVPPQYCSRWCRANAQSSSLVSICKGNI